jgi:predicted amidophosphoribosyltransferase
MIVAIVVIALLLAFKGNRNTGADLHRICRTCGTAHPAFARFCRRCGKKL